MPTGFKYHKVRQMFMETLLEMQRVGLNVNPLVDVQKIMDELTEANLIEQKFNKIIQWENQGRINNLFKIGA